MTVVERLDPVERVRTAVNAVSMGRIVTRSSGTRSSSADDLAHDRFFAPLTQLGKCRNIKNHAAVCGATCNRRRRRQRRARVGGAENLLRVHALSFRKRTIPAQLVRDQLEPFFWTDRVPSGRYFGLELSPSLTRFF